MSVLNKQVGGSHYLKFKIQPDYFAVVNGLNGVEMNFIKYLIRDKGNKVEDLNKALHSVQTLKELGDHVKQVIFWNISPRCFVELNKIEAKYIEAFYATMRHDYDLAESEIKRLLNLEGFKHA
ncbi:TPA: hypothetical protein ACX6Q6_003543 [Photobacterium damselae]